MFNNKGFFSGLRVSIVVAAVAFAVSFASAAPKKAGVPASGGATTGVSASGSPESGEPSSGDQVYEATKDLHTTGVPQDVDTRTWRLVVTGEKVKNPLSLSYQDLEKMEMSEKNVTCVCPGFFADKAVWEGVPLKDVLSMARVGEDWNTVEFHSIDGYRSSLSRKEVDGNFTILALKVNGVTLPKEHGYPLRLVAENVTGGKWVKWIDRIEVK